MCPSNEFATELKSNNDNKYNNINKRPCSWDGTCLYSPPEVFYANVQPYCSQNRPCIVNNHILQEVALLINRTQQIQCSRPKISPSSLCTLRCRWITKASAVDGKKPRKFIKRPSASSSLTATGGAIPQWTESIPSYWWDNDGDQKTKYHKTRRCREQSSSNSTEENGDQKRNSTWIISYCT